MTIHHATKAKAEKTGVSLTQGEDSRVTAIKGQSTFTHPNASAAVAAVLLSEQLRAEYPALGLFLEEDGWVVKGPDDVVVTGPDKDVPDLTDVLESADELGIDPSETTEEAADDEPTGKVVVRDLYKKLYKELGRKADCGDWLALTLEQLCHQYIGKKAIFSTTIFQLVLEANAVDQSGKWAALPNSGQHGWIGRWRMNGRQKLEMRVLETGKLYGPEGAEIPVPEEALAALTLRHNKPKVKKAS